MDRIQRKPENDNSLVIALLERIAATLDTMKRHQDEYYAVALTAKYPFGKPTDRWARPRRGDA